MKHVILLANNQLELNCTGESEHSAAQVAMVGTLLSNMAYYGYAPSLEALQVLRGMNRDDLVDFWRATEPAFKSLTGDDRQMSAFVVYQNFPREVLEMSRAQYWVSQILMYMGAPNEWFTEAPAERAALNEKLTLKTLALAKSSALADIYAGHISLKARWTDAQKDHAIWLARDLAVANMDLSTFGFKENGVRLIAKTLDCEGTVTMADATDVLRLAAVLSDAEPSLRGEVKFRSFTRAERRLMLGLLEDSKNLLADMALRPTLWKKLLQRLHPGDFKFGKVIEAYHQLYEGEYTTFNGEVEAKLHSKDASVLALLQSRPGDFVRRLHTLYGLFGMQAVQAFAAIASKLQTAQLLKLRAYLVSVNSRLYFVHPPKGNWTKAKFVANEKVTFTDEALTSLKAAIDAPLAKRMAEVFPQGVDLAVDVEHIKLQTNDQELAPYGRGTVFPIPPEMSFLRTASYWKHKSGGYNTWFDNGFNLYSENWAPMGTCCWNSAVDNNAAVFSGDPTNSKELAGRACQMIDLYLDKLQAQGVRYAVWNVLCYSNVPFSDADEVLATLQWGERAQEGKLYEPARAQMVFPLKGNNKTKYVAYIDVQARQLVYMDANLAGQTSSAEQNESKLAEMMPAFVEYLRSLPSVADLFVHAPQGTVPVLYSDAERNLEAGQSAYVFKPQNTGNSFEPLALEKLL